MKKKRIRLWLIVPVLLLLTGALLAAVFHVLPRRQAQRTMPLNGSFVITQQADHSLLLSWPAAFDVDFYRVSVCTPSSSDGNREPPQVLWQQDVSGCTQCVLPQLPEQEARTLSVTCGVRYRSFGREKVRLGDNPITVTTTFAPPKIKDITWEADPDRKLVWVDYSMDQGECCRVSLEAGGSRTQIRETSEKTFCLTFGDKGELPVPAYGTDDVFTFDAYRREPGLLFYGSPSGEMTIRRDDLLGRELNLQFAQQDFNVCTMSWDETKGDTYEIQLWNPDTQVWDTVRQIPADQDRFYTSPHMPIFESFTYRVAAVGQDPMEGSEYTAVSQEFTMETKESPIFCTVWPTRELTLYEDPQMTRELGTVPEGGALCVLDARENAFGVRSQNLDGYIDSRYCLINLPEYVGKLCQYRITNSFDCKYMVHEFEIPDMTGTTLEGYEHICLAQDSFLVPLLYPTARKLAAAGKDAMDRGYQLKIYDAFRPRETTDRIYRQTQDILDLPIPENTYTGADVESLNLPEPPDNVTEDLGPNGLTYKMVMVNELYGLEYFLAAGGSAHNQGLAMDLTMASLETGEEIRMQTSIHDLSRYSVVTDNISGSDLLADIMTGAGFGTLVSEWWHFQDNESRKALDPPYVYNGLSGACWMADDEGWRYRSEDGAYYANCIAKIDGSDWVFDQQGYVHETP